MMITRLPAIVINSGAYGVGCFVATRFSDSQRRSRIVAEWIRASLIRRDPGPSFARLFSKRPRAIEGREK
jgi:hypothetical protein